jgi:hypothetical protein
MTRLPTLVSLLVVLAIGLARATQPTPAPHSPFTVLRLAPGARVVYVSAAGNDNASGLTPTNAKRSIEAAWPLVRDGAGDWMLLRRGDTFTGATLAFNKSRAVLGGYGAGPRPIIQTEFPNVPIMAWGAEPLDHAAIVGVELRATGYSGTPPQGARFPALSVTRPGRGLLIEDVKVSRVGGGFSDGLIVQGYPGVRTGDRFRLNIVDGPYTTNDNDGGTGLFLSFYSGPLLEGNVFLGPATSAGVFDPGRHMSHAVYAGENNPSTLIARGNLAAFGGRTNFNIRAGGTVTGNVSIDGAQGITCGIHYASSIAWADITGNLITGNRNNQNGQPLGFGISLERVGGRYNAGGQLEEPFRVRGNLIAHGSGGADSKAIVLNGQCTDVWVEQNTVYRWAPGWDSLQVNPPAVGCRLVANEVQQLAGGMVKLNGPGVLAYFERNTYTPGLTFRQEGGPTWTFDQWRVLREPTAQAGTKPFPEPARCVESYAASLGLTKAGYLEALRSRPPGQMPPALTAGALIGHMHQGFAR